MLYGKPRLYFLGSSWYNEPIDHDSGVAERKGSLNRCRRVRCRSVCCGEKQAHAVFYGGNHKFYNRICKNGCRTAIINRKLQHICLFTVIQAVFIPKMLLNQYKGLRKYSMPALRQQRQQIAAAEPANCSDHRGLPPRGGAH